MTPGKNTKISICMIVRNEEHFLPGCLQSVAGLADEIIVVDTGSKDTTIEIAQSFGAKVYSHKWNDNFSEHRNQSLSYATGDWVFQIDADEKLVTSSEETRRIIEAVDEKVNALHIFIQDQNRQDITQSVFQFPRIFRRSANPSYYGNVHNQLKIEGESQSVNIIINHYGYDLDHDQQYQKSIRTKRLLLKQLEENPRNWVSVLNLIYVEAALQNTHEVIRLGERLLSQVEKSELQRPFFWPVFHILFRAYIMIDNKESAFNKLYDFNHYVNRDHLDLIHLKVHAAFLQHDWEHVRKKGESFLQLLEGYKSNLQRASLHNVQSLNRAHEVYLWLAIAGISLNNWVLLANSVQNIEKDPAFKQSHALELLEHIPHAPPIMVSRVLHALWRRFASGKFILSTLKLLSLEELQDEDRALLEAEFLPIILAEKSYESGLLLMRLAHYAEAAEVFLRFENDKDLAEKAMFFAAQAYMEISKMDVGIAILERLTKKFPQNKQALILLDSVLNKDDASVLNATAVSKDMDNILKEAAEMCLELMEAQKLESAVMMIGKIYQVLSPGSELEFHDLKDIARNITMVERLARSQDLPELSTAAGKAAEFAQEKLLVT